MAVVFDRPDELTGRDGFEASLIEQTLLADEPAIVAEKEIDSRGAEWTADETFVWVLRIRLQGAAPLKGNGMPRIAETTSAIATTTISAKPRPTPARISPHPKRNPSMMFRVIATRCSSSTWVASVGA